MSCLRPQQRDKLGWYACHRCQINKAIKSQASVVVIGNSLARWLSRYPEVWKVLSQHNIVNFGIGGDGAENVLWWVDNLSFSPSVKLVVILVGRNKMLTDKSEDIASSIMSSVVKLREKYPQLYVVVTRIIPRGLHHSPLREKIRQTNGLLISFCEKTPYTTTFIDQSVSWTNDSGRLTERYFYKDQLHLFKAGYHILANQISEVIASVSAREIPMLTKPNFRKRVYTPLPPDVCTYRPPVISPPPPPTLIDPAVNHIHHHRRHKRQPSHISPPLLFSPSPPTPSCSTTVPYSSPSTSLPPPPTSPSPFNPRHRSPSSKSGNGGYTRLYLCLIFSQLLCLGMWVMRMRGDGRE